MLQLQNFKRQSSNHIILCVAFSLIITSCYCAYDLTLQQFISSTPKTFGLLTVTHARGGQYSYFKNHLKKYAQMECELMTEFSIVWNNDISPEQAGITAQQNWKRPVYFRKTPHNSMDFRYLIPQQSKAQVYFSIDDDVTIQCSQLIKGFNFWRQRAIGDVAPLMGYGLRGFDTNLRLQQIRYTDPLKGKFYQLILIGIAWVPRHFFEIYNSNKTYQISKMRQIVQQKNNCDDIALNYLVNYFYPQLTSVPMKGQYQMNSPKIAQAYSPTHYKYRNQCTKLFIQILGYCPVKIVDQTFDSNTEIKNKMFKNPLLQQTIYLKRRLLARLIQQNEQSQVKIKQHYLPVQALAQNQANSNVAVDIVQDLQVKLQQAKQQLIAVTRKLQITSSQNQVLMSKIQQCNTGGDSKTIHTKQQHEQQLSGIVVSTMTSIQIVSVLSIVCMGMAMVYYGCKKQQDSYRVVEEYLQ